MEYKVNSSFCVKSHSVDSLMSLQKFMTRNVQDSRNHKQQCVCLVCAFSIPTCTILAWADQSWNARSLP